MAKIKISSDPYLRVRGIKKMFRQARNLVMDCNGGQGAGLICPSTGGTLTTWSPNAHSAGTSISSGPDSNTYSSTGFVFAPGSSNTFLNYTQNMPSPKANHKYYGGLLWRTDTGFTASDARFEWFLDDTEEGHLTFCNKTDTKGEWVILSDIKSLNTVKAGSWYLRDFVVSPTASGFSCKHIVIDLTETFGRGREPTKEWCDKAVREWRTFDGFSVVSEPIQVGNFNNTYLANSTGTLTAYDYEEFDSISDPREPSLLYEIESINPEVYLYLQKGNPPLADAHYLYVSWMEYVKNQGEYNKWVQTDRDMYIPEAEPCFSSAIKLGKQYFARGGGFMMHQKISGYNSNRGFIYDNSPFRIDLNGASAPGFMRMYDFYMIDAYDGCPALSKYTARNGGTLPTVSQLTKDFFDYWFRGLSLPIIHIGDPMTKVGYDDDYNLVCNDVEIHPETDGVYIEDNGVVWCKGVSYS